MGPRAWCTAIALALLTTTGAVAQDVTLTAREGGIRLDGALQGFDGEFYRIETGYGVLTVDAEGVICEGPGCPDLTVPLATIRFVGAPETGAALLPPLWQAFATRRGLGYAAGDASAGYTATLFEPASGKILANISFSAMSPDASHAAMAAGAAEFTVAAATDPDFGNRALAMDALIAIMADDNPTGAVATRDLAAVLGGDIVNWQGLGGPDMPIMLHAMRPDTDAARALVARLGRDIAGEVTHPDLASLAAAVAADPYALAITVQSAQGAAQRMVLTDSCGFALQPTPMAVKAEDYPLSLPIYLLTPRRRLPLIAREFLEFLATPPAQEAIAAAGFIDRGPVAQSLTADGARLMNAIQGASDEVVIADLKALVAAMTGAERLSLTFRFEDGSSALDAASQQNLADLAEVVAGRAICRQSVVFCRLFRWIGGCGREPCPVA